MLKPFTTYCVFIALLVSSNIKLQASESALCPKPDKKDNHSIKTTSPDILHQYMIKANKSSLNSDWVVDKTSESSCDGYYIEPINPSAQTSLDQKDADTFISANSASAKSNNELELQGDVEMYKGSMRLSCNKMHYFNDSQRAELTGNLTIRESGFLLKADSGALNNNLKHAILLNTQYIMHKHNIRGTAEKLRLYQDDEKEQMIMEKAMISSCPPEQNGWSLSASTLDLDNKEGWGSAYNAIVRLKDVPVFYFPYMSFPITDKRKTGFLFPSLAISSNNIDITAPYYFNIADNFDMTYSPRLQTEHALSHALETRFKQRWGEWQINGQYINKDKKIGDHSGLTHMNQDNSDRWAFGIKEFGQLTPNVNTYINYQRVSDNDFFQDWGSQGLDITKTLNIRRDAGLNFNSLHWQIHSSIVDYQSLEEMPDQKLLYRQLPRIDFNYFDYGHAFSFNPNLAGQYVYFQHKAGLVESQRLHLQPSLSYRMIWPAITTVTEATYKRTDFLLTDNDDLDSHYQKTGHVAIDVPTFSIDSQLFFERNTKQYTQTLTPRIFYYYAQYKNQDHLPSFDTSENTFSWQQLFRGERFSGYDRIGDANQLTLSLTTEFLSSESGRRISDMGVGQILYFADRKVSLNASDRQLIATNPTMPADEVKRIKAINNQRMKQYFNNRSDIASQINWYPSNHQKITSNFLLSSYTGQFQETSLAYQWRTDNRHILNLGYRYVKNVPLYPMANKGEPILIDADINEVDFSVIWPFTNQWSGIYRYQYDITHQEPADNIIGLVYDNCCLNVMLAYQRERRIYDAAEWANNNFRSGYTDHYKFEFTLKGLGTMISSVSKLLHENIPGFTRD